MSDTDPWTVGRLLTWTARYLGERGAATARLDAEVLLAHARGCRRIELYTAFDETVADDVRALFRELVRRRADGMPVAYLVGAREFYSLPFRVTSDVLIPRPETEFVVLALLDRIKERAAGDVQVQIADVGTGSGILAVCAARHVPGGYVTAVDISAAALEVARDNARRHGVAERIELIESDLFASVPSELRFDFIVSNPPYVSDTEMEQLSKEVRFEPRVALAAGPRATEVIERLIPQAAERLNPGGWLLFEISPMIESAVRELLAADERLEVFPTIKDLAGLARVAQARRKNNS